MNCRRVNGLLSAYLDGELTGAEMLEIRAHMDNCAACDAEHRALRDTKYLVASLAYKTPRAELEALLADRTYRGANGNPAAMHAFQTANAENGAGLRPWPIAATILLSLTGLYLASTALNPPGGDSVSGEFTVAPPLYPVITASRVDVSPVALTPVASGLPVMVWGAGAPMVVGTTGPVLAQPLPVIPPMVGTSRSSISVTVMSNGRGGDTVRVLSQSIAGVNGQMTVTSTTTSGPLIVPNVAPMWQIRTTHPILSLPPQRIVLRRVGIR